MSKKPRLPKIHILSQSLLEPNQKPSLNQRNQRPYKERSFTNELKVHQRPKSLQMDQKSYQHIPMGVSKGTKKFFKRPEIHQVPK